MFDSFGREINYLRISVTDRCNMRCVYCMPPEGVTNIPHSKILTYEQIAEVAATASRLGFTKFRITGGEPLVRKNLKSLISLLDEIPGSNTIGMTTNGTLLAPVVQELKQCGLDSVNISLDTLEAERYSEITRGGNVRDVLDGIISARDAGLPVKLNVVMLDQQSIIDLKNIRAFADKIGVQVQTITSYRLDALKVDGGVYDRPPPCSLCNRIRLLADGTLRPCLHGSAGIPVDFNDISASIIAAVESKPVCGLSCSETTVCEIGG